jgi:hypothetical protein
MFFPPARYDAEHVMFFHIPPRPAPTGILPGGNPPGPPRRLAGPRRGLATLAIF